MSAKKLVTSRQAEMVRQMANDKGVGRELFQGALDDGMFARVLEELKIRAMGLTPPPGARLYVVRVRVKLDCEWQEAVNRAGPNTPDYYNVRKVADLYPPTGTGIVERDIILLNYPSGGSWDKAKTWASGEKLLSTEPRDVFAIGEQHPKLHLILKVDSIYVVATTDCAFDDDRRACVVWWYGTFRRAGLYWVSDFGGSGDWFAFRK